MSSYAIYRPNGRAQEYAEWACNFHVGCSNDCSYCYCKKGLLAHAMGGKVATLKKCFRNIGHAKDVFEKEMLSNRVELKKHGLFFTFTSDPMLSDTIELTVFAISCCLCAKIPVKILTKRADWVDGLIKYLNSEFHFDLIYLKNIAFGFTLTGHDELEPGASTNFDRINAMKKLYWYGGFKIFASIEPIIDFKSSFYMIKQSVESCHHYKIGLASGQKITPEFKADLFKFVEDVNWFLANCGRTVYWKDSITKITGPVDAKCCVGRDYNLFIS